MSLVALAGVTFLGAAPILLLDSATDILVIVLVVVLLFGASKLPQLARSMGRAKSEFEAGKREGERQLEDEERLHREAKELGIDTLGKTPEVLRREVAEARQARSASAKPQS
ncbi:MAG: Sec-independent protein translocase subunit TatA/TatB [Thermoplasmatota archaeon]